MFATLSFAGWGQAPAPAGAPAAPSNSSAAGSQTGAVPATPDAATPSPSSNAAPVPASQPAQDAAGQAAAGSQPASQPAAGGKLHGAVKSGNIPLPGVTVTAQNTLTGKRFSTTTDVNGAWTLNIPQNGRYVIRTQFAAFAQGSQEAVLNDSSREQLVNFQLILASREVQQVQQQQTAMRQGPTGAGQGVRQLSGNQAESVSLMNTLSDDTSTEAGIAGASGVELPSIAGSSDFSDESVAVSGVAGQVSAFAGMNPGGRDGMGGGPGGPGGAAGTQDGQAGLFGGPGGGAGGFGGAFGGGGVGGGGGAGFGAGGGGGFGGGGGGRGGGGGGGGRGGNFRGFNPGQPHGAIAWNGTNSIFNALPFSLTGQPQDQPSNGTNRFTLTFMSAPYIPHLTKPSGKDTVFLTLAGSRSSTPDDFYATLPTDAERGGDFSAAGLPAIYNPANFQQFAYNATPNVIPPTQIAAQAKALLALFPEPNITPSGGQPYNYHLLTTGQSNSTQAGVRYNRSLGANATQPGGRGGGGGRRGGSQNQGLRQSINANLNWSHSASDSVNIIPVLGGKSESNSYSVQAGYTVGYHRVTSIFNATWNRSDIQATNFFTNTSDNPLANSGVTVPNNVPLNYGYPSISLSNFQGLSQSQPNFSLSQTISFSEVVSWIHGKHNVRFGADYRRVHRDFLAGSNATGNFTFSGLFTEDAAQDQGTGSSFADFLLGLPQSTSLNSSLTKSYLRDNVYDAYAMDDWRMSSSLTINYGIRYEYFAPYTEKYGHLSEVVTNPDGGFTNLAEAAAGTNGLPSSLVFPYHKAFRPNASIAWRVPKIKQTVVRAGFGMNYVTGEYATFANTMARQPPFTNEQTNQEAVGNSASSACARTTPITCFTLANGFPAPATLGSYAVDSHYPLPYVMAWNLNIQKSLPWGIVMNIGYNGARSNHQDTVVAPRALANSPGTDPSVVCVGSLACVPLSFRYEEARSFSKSNAGTVGFNKRLTKGFSAGANYTYAHVIDDAGALGSVGGVGVQNWQNVLGELGNSSIDIRHKVQGTYLYELPFGADKTWVTTGVPSHILEGFSVSGTFTFATGGWLSPSYSGSVLSTNCGTGGVFRPNLTGASVTAGGGTLHQWFNPAAYALPAGANSTTNPYPCGVFGNARRNSIEGPGTVSNNMALSKTVGMGETRSMEIRAQINNVFNTVQYAGVGATVNQPNFGQVTSVAGMRSFQFSARFRF